MYGDTWISHGYISMIMYGDTWIRYGYISKVTQKILFSRITDQY